MNGVFNKYLWKCKIDITEFTDGDSHYITLRSPTTLEMKSLVKMQNELHKVDEDNVEAVFDVMHDFNELCCTLIIDHDFCDGDKKIPSKDVSEFLDSQIELSKAVMQEFMTNLPLLKKSGKE